MKLRASCSFGAPGSTLCPGVGHRRRFPPSTGYQPLTCSDRRKLCHSSCHWTSSPTRPAATRNMMRSSSTWGTRGEGHVCVNLGCLGCPSLYENRSIPFSWLIHCPPFIQHIFTGFWVLGLCPGREEPAKHRAQCAPLPLAPIPTLPCGWCADTEAGHRATGAGPGAGGRGGWSHDVPRGVTE